MAPAEDSLHTSAREHKRALLDRLRAQRTSASAAQPATLRDAVPQGSNIVGVGFGAKVTAGSAVEDLAVRVYVRTKLAHAALDDRERIPHSVDGVPTDVIAVGDIVARTRPTPCGVSVGHVAITAGTLGCLVRRAEHGDQDFILSNNHVLANSNDAQPGDAILQPGRADGGTASDQIAELDDYEVINFGGVPNTMDAAVARVLQPGDVTPDVLVIGRVSQPPMTASLYQSVRKHGRTTLHTVGVVMDYSADIRVNYGQQVAEFVDQLAVVGAGGVFSDGGDSGSLIVDAVTRQPVALLFAGGRDLTFANPIAPVLERFDATIV